MYEYYTSSEENFNFTNALKSKTNFNKKIPTKKNQIEIKNKYTGTKIYVKLKFINFFQSTRKP